MTRIDFHTGVPDRISYACRLLRKAYGAGSRAVVLAREDELAALDEALWTFSEPDFIPHVRVDDELAPRTPILLASQEPQAFPHYEVLVNLSGEIPAGFASFERLVEVISLEETDKRAGRERYRSYQQRGYPLTHFIADPS